MDIQTLHAEFFAITQDKRATGLAVEAVAYAASHTHGTIEPIASAYKLYLASGQLPYNKEDLAKAVYLDEKYRELGLSSSLVDILHHGL